jgi:hypothetical protein
MNACSHISCLHVKHIDPRWKHTTGDQGFAFTPLGDPFMFLQMLFVSWMLCFRNSTMSILRGIFTIVLHIMIVQNIKKSVVMKKTTQATRMFKLHLEYFLGCSHGV